MSLGRKKNFKIRTGARTASKGLEKELKRKAKRLVQDPTLVLPKCTVDVPYFKKLEKKLKDIQRMSGSKPALEKLAKKGDKLARAYAATLLLNHEDKIPYLAVFRSPFGDIGYVLRGSTSREKLVGVQHYDNPRIKMMAYLEEVKSKKLFMFVTEDELICTGTEAKPPKEVIDPLPKRLGKGMRRFKDHIISKDLDIDTVKGLRPWKEPYLVVRWIPTNIVIAKSQTHAFQNQDNTFATCASYMATTKISDLFDVEVVLKPICDKGDSCLCHPPKKKEKKTGGFLTNLGKVKELTDKEKYLQGKMMDHRLIEKETENYKERLKEVGKTVYIIENRCYGDSREEMIKALDPNGEEMRVLKIFLEKHSGPIISKDRSVNLLMAPFWEEVGLDVLKKRFRDKKVASRVYKKYPVPRYQPMTVVQEGLYFIEESEVRDSLPKLVDPPRMIDFAYECAISYLVRGKEGAHRMLVKYPGDEIKLKAAKYAFVKHLDLEKTSGWSYTTHEMGYAQGLDEIVARIVTRDPDGFRNALIELWKATGSTVELKFTK